MNFAGNIRKKIGQVVCLFVVLFLFACTSKTIEPQTLLTTQPPTLTTNTVRLANGTWPPYNGEDLPHAGCESWVIEEAFALQGITVEYEFFPWARSYNLSATGVFDGTLAWADTPDHRLDHYISKESISTQEWVFFFKENNPFKYTSMEDLVGKTVGVTSGYAYSDAFMQIQQTDAVSFLESSSDLENFKMLFADRIDLFAMERNVGKWILKTSFSADEQGQIRTTATPFALFQTRLLLSKAVPGNDLRMEQFDTGFEKLVEIGRYTEIMDQCSQ